MIDVKMWGRALAQMPKLSQSEWQALDPVAKWLVACRASVLFMTFTASALGGCEAAHIKFAAILNLSTRPRCCTMMWLMIAIEDEDSSKEVEKAYKKYGIKLSLGVEKVSAKDNGKNVTITAVEKGKTVEYKFEKGLPQGLIPS